MAPIEHVSPSGARASEAGASAGGGLGTRVNVMMLATVLPVMEAAVKEFLTSQGIGSQINVTI